MDGWMDGWMQLMKKANNEERGGNKQTMISCQMCWSLGSLRCFVVLLKQSNHIMAHCVHLAAWFACCV
jgi:hypothetical protein